MLIEYFRISLRNLSRRRLRSWLTMIGIIIGITAVVSLIGMGEGLKNAITSQFSMLGTDKLTVSATGGFGPPGTAVISPLTQNNLEKINRINGVQEAVGRLIRSGKLEFNDVVSFGYAASIPDGTGRKMVEEALNLEASNGRLLRDGDTKKIMIGSKLGNDELNGKKITIGSKVLIQDKEFQVAGILEPIGNFFMDGSVIMNEDDLRELLDIPDDEFDLIVVKVEEGSDITDVQKNIERLMRKERHVKKGEEDFTVESPQAILGQVNSTLFAVQLFLYIIAGISILVGGIGIMNTMFMSVVERTREIGIMKSIGARNSAVFSLFFIESGLIGMVGGMIGAGFGIGLSKLLANLGKHALGADLIQAHISPWLVISAVTGSFLLGSIFGIIPALNAAKLHPVDALRHKK